MKKSLRSGNRPFKVVAYVVCIILAILSLMPFVIMIINSTRSTYEIQQHAISLIPSKYLMNNFKVYDGKTFDAWKGFVNSIIISSSTTALVVYFSSLTAYALVAYRWKLRGAFFTMILCVMMIPSQISYPASQGAYYIPGQVRLEAWVLKPHNLVPAPPPPLTRILQSHLSSRGGTFFWSLPRVGLSCLALHSLCSLMWYS